MILDDDHDGAPRLGFPDLPPIWQGAKPHGSTPVGLARVGDRSAMHRRVGCATVAVTMLVRHMLRPTETVLQVAANARARGRAVYPLSDNPAAAGIPALVRAQPGLRVGVDVPGVGAREMPPVVTLQPLILDALRKGGGALVCVDFDSARPFGDPTGEHWCAAYAAERGHLYLADSATAKNESVSLRSLAGDVFWRDVPKPYRVVRVVTVFRA